MTNTNTARARSLQALAIGACLLAGQVAAEPAWTVRATQSGEYSSGSYGEVGHTQIWLAQTAVTAENTDWKLRFSAPWVRIRSTQEVFVTDSDLQIIGTETDRFQQQGPLDPSLSAVYKFPASADANWFVDAGVRIKLPLASRSKGFSTGRADYTALLDVTHDDGTWVSFISLAQRYRAGSAPGVRSATLQAGAGVQRRLGAGTRIGLAYDFRQRAATGDQHESEWTLTLNKRLAPSWNLDAYLVRGLSDASPDYAIGIGIEYRF